MAPLDCSRYSFEPEGLGGSFLREGVRVRVNKAADRKLNNQMGTLGSFDSASSRWSVKIEDGTLRNIEAAHLVFAPENIQIMFIAPPHSRWTESNRKTLLVAGRLEALTEEIREHHGVPAVAIYDNPAYFTARQWQRLGVALEAIGVNSILADSFKKTVKCKLTHAQQHALDYGEDMENDAIKLLEEGEFDKALSKARAAVSL